MKKMNSRMNETAKTVRISVAIECTKSWMSIPMLNPIPIYPFLLPPAQKYLLMHQLARLIMKVII